MGKEEFALLAWDVGETQARVVARYTHGRVDPAGLIQEYFEMVWRIFLRGGVKPLQRNQISAWLNMKAVSKMRKRARMELRHGFTQAKHGNVYLLSDLEVPPEPEGEELPEFFEHEKELVLVALQRMQKAHPREARILHDWAFGVPREETIAALGVSTSRISQLKSEAFEILRIYYRAALREYIEAHEL